MTRLSPGLVQGCFELLDIAARHQLTFPQLASSFARFSGHPSKEVIYTAQSLKWLRASEEGLTILTPHGSRLMSRSGYESMLRQALLDFIEVERPAWVQNATFGRMKVINFAGNEIGQIIVEAGLAKGLNNNEPVDEDVVAFWDAMAVMARGQKNTLLTEIGREGERLTIDHEEMRTKRRPKWVAIDNNEEGYDVLSVIDINDNRLLSIEVKSSRLGLNGSLHLTQNEWQRAQDQENHVFHLWSMSPNKELSLAIITSVDMEAHIPANLGQGQWESVIVPFKAFESYFLIMPRKESISSPSSTNFGNGNSIYTLVT